ncbi:tetratricopeptide repeat protein [Acaryochloris thomasi]|nr:tetratricopeptide repeat protein [Acaryochloris thomasi]
MGSVLGASLLLTSGLSLPVLAQPTLIARGSKGSIRKAERSYRRGEYSTALMALTQIIQQDPQDADAYFLRGIVHVTQRQTEAGFADFAQAIQLRPRLVSRYYLSGLDCVGFEPQKSVWAYTQDLKQNPKDAAAYAGRGRFYVALDKSADAIEDLLQATTLNVKDHESYWLLGQMYRSQGDYSAAISNYTKALELDPQNVSVYIERGTAHDYAGNSRLSLADYTKALDLDSTQARAYYNRGVTQDDPAKKIADYTYAIERSTERNLFTHLAYNNRGGVLRRLGKEQDAIASFTQAIALSPNYAAAYRSRGLVHSTLGQYQKAIEDYTQAIALNSNDALAHAARGLAYANLDKATQARRDYDRAVKLYPQASRESDYALVYYNRALLRAAENPKGALRDYSRAIQVSAEDADFFIDRGDVLDRLGKHQQAIEDYTQAIKLDANQSRAYNNRGVAREQQEDLEGALRDYGDAIATAPNDALAYRNRGSLRLRQSNYEGAAQDYTRVIQLSPEDAEAYYQRGLAHTALKEKQAALDDLQEAAMLAQQQKDPELYQQIRDQMTKVKMLTP